MAIASIFAHISLGAFLALFFVLYYVISDSKWKLYVEMMLAGGNIGLIFYLDSYFQLEDDTIRMLSIACCILAFLITTAALLVILSFVIKDKDDDDIIRLRDIILGQTSWIQKYYSIRSQEIDKKLNIAELEAREENITRQEEELEYQKKYIQEESTRLAEVAKKKPRIRLPERTEITLRPQFIESMPSYNSEMIRCMNDIHSCTESLLAKKPEEINTTVLKSYFISIATYISSDIFGAPTRDVRIHFRVYDCKADGYRKFVAVVGNRVSNQEMTFIPFSKESMIKRSYEYRRALIKSINITHDFPGNNRSIWQDYMTYTFYGIEYGHKPVLSFGISIRNKARYTDLLYFLNYFRLESFLQDNIERVNQHVNIVNILCGGELNV